MFRLRQFTAAIGFGGLLAAAAAIVSPAPAQGPAGAPVSFHTHVRPILQRRCSGCHNPGDRGGKLSVVTYAALKSGGIGGPGFVTGKPEDSPIYKMCSGKAPRMPKGGPPLAANELDTLRRWILQGGKDDTPQPKDPISQERPPVYKTLPLTSALAHSPDGELLAVSGYREVLLHKSDGSGIVARLVGRSQRIESVAWSPDGKLLAAVGGNPCRFGEVQLWDVEQRKQVGSVEIGFDVLYGVSFSPDGKMVGFGSAEKSVYLYSVPDLKPVMKFDNHADWVFGTTFSRDSKNMVSTSRDKSVKLIEIATKNFVDDINYQVYGGGYQTISRKPDADEVAVAGEEGLIRVYSIFKRQARNMMRDDFNLLRTFEKMDGPINVVRYSPDGAMLAAGGQSSQVIVYKVADGSKVVALTGHTGSIDSLSWHPKNGTLAVGGFDGTVRIYEIPSGKLVKAFVPVPLSATAAVRG
jgi:WD40 repeat protein